MYDHAQKEKKQKQKQKTKRQSKEENQRMKGPKGALSYSARFALRTMTRVASLYLP